MKTTEEGIRTARLFLLRSTPDRLSALIAGPSEYHRIFEHRVAEGYMEHPGALEFFLHQAQLSLEVSEWFLPYLIVHREDAALIGMCGYKGPPDVGGVVEIGYSVAPTYRGQGFASEAASALSAHAFALPGVRAIRAHTLPSINASTRVLTNSGFVHAGDINDPDDGALWRWQLDK